MRYVRKYYRLQLITLGVELIKPDPGFDSILRARLDPGLSGRGAARRRRSSGLTLLLTYGPEAIEQVGEMVRKAQSCCGFHHFELRGTKSGVHLTVTAPERARDVGDLLPTPFAPDVASSAPS